MIGEMDLNETSRVMKSQELSFHDTLQLKYVLDSYCLFYIH